jgi:putative glutathione S-transferase
LFTTLVRFDPVYVGHFKCNIRRLVDYPNLWGYVKDLYQIPGITDTVDIDYTKAHYYESHTHINPTGVIPKGPALDYATPHGREQLSEGTR